MGIRSREVAVVLTLVGCAGEAPPCEGEACGVVVVECEDGEACPGSVRWSRSLAVNVHGDATLSPSGQIFVTAGVTQDQQIIEPHLVSYDADGTFLYDKTIAAPGLMAWPSRPVFAGGGIFITASDRLYRYQPDGSVDYHAIAPEGSENGVNYLLIAPPPAIDASDRIYWQFLAATNQDGTLQWRTFVNPETRCESPVSVRPDRLLVTEGDTITAYDSTGTEAWAVTAPHGLRADTGCVTVAAEENVVSTMWCEHGFSVFVCGHNVRIDIESGEILSWTPPPNPVPITSSLLVDVDGTSVLFSIGPDGNPDYRSRMWRLNQEGEVVGEPIKLPWFGVFGASLGNDGNFYLATERGAAAIDRDGNVLWQYEPEDLAGRNAGAPAIGENGCVYYESVQQLARFSFDRQLVCLESTATGLAKTAWPRTSGDNYSALRIH